MHRPSPKREMGTHYQLSPHSWYAIMSKQVIILIKYPNYVIPETKTLLFEQKLLLRGPQVIV